jgi:hypothetical protein
MLLAASPALDTEKELPRQFNPFERSAAPRGLSEVDRALLAPKPVALTPMLQVKIEE